MPRMCSTCSICHRRLSLPDSSIVFNFIQCCNSVLQRSGKEGGSVATVIPYCTGKSCVTSVRPIILLMRPLVCMHFVTATNIVVAFFCYLYNDAESWTIPIKVRMHTWSVSSLPLFPAGSSFHEVPLLFWHSLFPSFRLGDLPFAFLIKLRLSSCHNRLPFDFLS